MTETNEANEAFEVGTYLVSRAYPDIQPYRVVPNKQYKERKGSNPPPRSISVLNHDGSVCYILFCDFDNYKKWVPKAAEKVWIDVKKGDHFIYPDHTGSGSSCVSMIYGNGHIDLTSPIMMFIPSTSSRQNWWNVPRKSVHPYCFKSICEKENENNKKEQKMETEKTPANPYPNTTFDKVKKELEKIIEVSTANAERAKKLLNAIKDMLDQ